MSSTTVVDYLIKNDVYVEWVRRCDNPARRLSLILAVIDMCRITEDCNDTECELIMSAVKRAKKLFRKGCDSDERK